MKASATKSVGLRQRGSGWRSIVWCLLLAFTLQSFITQTHIHAQPQGVASATVLKALSEAPNKPSPENSATDCPLCQAITHAGAFFTPTTPSLFLPVSWVESLAPYIIVGVVETISPHYWHSRAPPQH